MKTKLMIFLLFFLISASFVFAQSNDNSRTSFALLGGVNLQTFNGTTMSGNKIENDMIVGYHAGFNIQIPLAPEFFFQPGLLFSTKGAKNTAGVVTSTYKLSYIELPLNLAYSGLLGNGYVLLGFGPYIAYGIGGKVINEIGSVEVESDIKFQNVIEIMDPILAYYFRPFDAGGNIFAGYEMANGIFFKVNTQLGMLKINPEDKRVPGDKSIVKNTGFGVSLGYRF